MGKPQPLPLQPQLNPDSIISYPAKMKVEKLKKLYKKTLIEIKQYESEVEIHDQKIKEKEKESLDMMTIYEN